MHQDVKPTVVRTEVTALVSKRHGKILLSLGNGDYASSILISQRE